MRRRDLAAYARLPLWYHRIAEAGDEHALVEQGVAHLNRCRRLAYDDRNDGRLAGQRLEPRLDDLFAEVARVVSQSLYALRLLLDQPNGAHRARRDRGWRRVREELGAGPLRRVGGEWVWPRHEATGSAAEGLAQCRRDD